MMRSGSSTNQTANNARKSRVSSGVQTPFKFMYRQLPPANCTPKPSDVVLRAVFGNLRDILRSVRNSRACGTASLDVRSGPEMPCVTAFHHLEPRPA